jgi:2-polyprenyl-3-methyl-5-hydroxy-6-metoxy-1,4-benzoquinol methylase
MFAILPDGFDPDTLYNDEYFHSTSGSGFTDYDELWRKCCGRFYVPRLSRLREFTPGTGLLDVGCAGGQLLCAARARGFRVAGIERAPGMRRKAAEAARCTVYDSIPQALASGHRFECITMFEVIEHLVDPLSTLKDVAGLLEPGGVIALSTPNCERPGAREGRPINIWFCPPLHISYFTAQTLRRCLVDAGLTVLAIDGLEHYCRAMAGEIVLPDWLIKVLTPIRRGKRLRPHGLFGRLLKRIYQDRIALYRRRAPADTMRTDVLEVYAIKPA